MDDDLPLTPQVAAADLLLMGDEHAGARPAEALARYEAAAGGGDALAHMRMALMAAQGLGRAPDWREAFARLTQSALLGNGAARRQLEVLSECSLVGDGDVRAAGSTLDPALLLTPPPVRALSESPRVGAIDGFATPAMCAWLVERAERLLEPTMVYVGGQLRADARRTARAARFDFLRRDMIVAVLQERLARLIRLQTPFHEPPNVLSYEPGEQFSEHFDFIDPNGGFRAEIEAIGQRVATCLTYLNDKYEGGETYFPEIDLRYRGKPGDALIFFNVAPGREVDRRTRHAGLPPTAGRKWLLSQWVREKMLPLM